MCRHWIQGDDTTPLLAVQRQPRAQGISATMGRLNIYMKDPFFLPRGFKRPRDSLE